MSYFYPRSFLSLLVLGFAVVTAPLVLALITSALSVNRLADQGEHAIREAVERTHASRTLLERLTDLERAARQYLVLGDDALIEQYARVRGRFLDTAQDLARRARTDGERERIATTIAEERGVFELLRAASPAGAGTPGPAGERILATFGRLAELARAGVADGDGIVEREIERMGDLAARAQTIVLWQLAAMVPLVLLVAAGFAFLIARPIREIDLGIRRLGHAELGAEIRVNGPADLRYLGEQLDWLRRRLLELEEQKNRFLGHVSHELKTPLTALREGTDLLSEGAAGPLNTGQRDIVRILRDNTLVLRRLIEDLLNLSAARALRANLVLREVAIRPLVERVAADQRMQIIAKRLTLLIDVTDRTFVADQDKLRIIIDNLLSNAIKFTPIGGTVRIGVGESSDDLVLTVADSGPGVAPQDRERIFEPFYQGRTPTDGPVKGSGLGLAIVREYAEAHGGRAELAAGSGPGARFEVRIPHVAAPAEVGA